MRGAGERRRGGAAEGREAPSWKGDFDVRLHERLFGLEGSGGSEEDEEDEALTPHVLAARRAASATTRLYAVRHVSDHVRCAAQKWSLAVGGLLLSSESAFREMTSPRWFARTIDEIGVTAMKSFMPNTGPGSLNFIFTPLLFGADGQRVGDGPDALDPSAQGFRAAPFLDKERTRGRRGRRSGASTLAELVLGPAGGDDVLPEAKVRKYLSETRRLDLRRPRQPVDPTAVEEGRAALARYVSDLEGRAHGLDPSRLTEEHYDAHEETWRRCVEGFRDLLTAARLVRALASLARVLPEPRVTAVATLPTLLGKEEADRGASLPGWVRAVVEDAAEAMETPAHANYYILATTLGMPPWTWSHLVHNRHGRRGKDDPVRQRILRLAEQDLVDFGAPVDHRAFTDVFAVAGSEGAAAGGDVAVANLFRGLEERLMEVEGELDSRRNSYFNEGILRLPHPTRGHGRYGPQGRFHPFPATTIPVALDHLREKDDDHVRAYVRAFAALCEEVQEREDGSGRGPAAAHAKAFEALAAEAERALGDDPKRLEEFRQAVAALVRMLR